MWTIGELPARRSAALAPYCASGARVPGARCLPISVDLNSINLNSIDLISIDLGRDTLAEMPFHNPISNKDSDSRGSRGQGGGLASLVQAEKLVQIAFVLPCAMLICWGAGWWIEHHLGLHGAAIGGLIFGLIAGMVSVIRMALGAGNAPARSNRPGPSGDSQ